MIIVFIVPLVLTALILVEWRIRQTWIRISVVLIAVGFVGAWCVSLGHGIGGSLVKCNYDRYLSVIVNELYLSSNQNEQVTLAAQIKFLHKNLPNASKNESQMVILLNDFSRQN